ncbi:MAG TPA: VIT1/CCC1 transporter family protein [Candidatus Dormibacteraeota bacterium]
MRSLSTNDAADRLLRAWRGEIEARAMYELLAARTKDPRRAGILRQLADAEATHRGRLEARMKELGVPIPDPASVRLSPWMQLQARLAPLDRVLAVREAAEDSEVDGLYKVPTGDADTDRVLREIRHDEASHSKSVSAMRQGGEGSPPPSGPKGTLKRILDRESWHQTGGGWVSGAIYGANDGLAAVFGIVSGVSGATGGGHFVLTAGLAGAVASALSMATGAFLAERSEAEVAHANVERERREIEEHPEEEKEELSLFYQLKGLSKEDADALAEKLSHNPEAMLKLLAGEEFGFGGGSEGGGSAVQASLAAGISTGVGAMIPVIPFFWLSGTTGVIVAAAVSLVAHFLVGAAKSLFTLRSWWAAGLEMTAAGIIVGTVTYALGLVFHGA